MGFTKRFITKDSIMFNPDFWAIEQLFRADALILDDWGSNFSKYYDRDWQKYQSIRESLIEKNSLSSGELILDGLDDSKISNQLINLKSNPDWIDINLCLKRFSTDVPKEISGNFEDMINFCIDLIENELDDN